MNLYNLTHNLILSLFKGKTLGGKYLSRKQIADSKTGRMKWTYKYKPMSQRGAHEVTGKTFQKKTGGSSDEHKSLVEKALQSGNRVSLHILRDYPDLVQKFGMSKRLEKADKIKAKVQALKADKVKNQTPAADIPAMETTKEPDISSQIENLRLQISKDNERQRNNIPVRGDERQKEVQRKDDFIELFLSDIDASDNNIESGSDRQKEWAKQIKSENMNKLKNKYKLKIRLSKEDSHQDILKDNLKSDIEVLSNQTDAKWWIDNRSSISDSDIEKLKKIQEFNKKPNKKDFSSGIQGKYKDGVFVQSVKWTDGTKGFKLFSPKIPELISGIQDIKNKAYEKDYVTRKKQGVPRWADSYWQIPEAYEPDLRKLLENYLEK